MNEEEVDYGYDWCSYCGAEFYCSARDHEETCEYNPTNGIVDTTNRDDRINRINPQLSCSHCPPNRGMDNSNWHERNNRTKNKPKKKIAKDRNRGRDNKYGNH